MKLLTHSLLSSWLWLLKDEWSEDPMQEFMLVLNREPTPTSQAMQDGIDFENMVTDIVNGEYDFADDNDPIFRDKWFGAASEVAYWCKGGILQHKASKPITVNGNNFLLYGRLDCLKGGRIIDIKFSKKYSRGKYYDSTQHPVYMELVPEAEAFSYLISNGTDVWEETYRRDETRSIYPIIIDFVNWLKRMDLYEIYEQKWSTR